MPIGIRNVGDIDIMILLYITRFVVTIVRLYTERSEIQEILPLGARAHLFHRQRVIFWYLFTPTIFSGLFTQNIKCVFIMIQHFKKFFSCNRKLSEKSQNFTIFK